MKISEFSGKCNLSRETIRYYTNEKLILPHKIKHYYDYDEQCLKDITMIIKLKKMSFSIVEIKDILNFLRLETVAFPNLNELLLEYFEKKLRCLEDEKETILKKEQELKKEIETIKLSAKNTMQKEEDISGISLSFLSLFECRKCHDTLYLKKGKIKNDEILEGVLQCNCGMEYKIHEGILFCEGYDTVIKAPSVKKKKDIDEKYPNEYNAVKTLAEDWLRKKIEKDLNEKSDMAVLDLTLMGGVYSKKILEQRCSNDMNYVACERWLSFLKVSKRALEAVKERPKALFCCGDVKNAPFKERCFDQLIDVYGTTTDMRTTGDYKLKHKIDLLRNEGRLYGLYCDIRNISEDNEVNIRKCFDFELIMAELKSLKQLTLLRSPNTGEMGELNSILKRNGKERFSVYGFVGEKNY